jgi:hypothetical protein
MKKNIYFIIFIFLSKNIIAQNVGINITDPHFKLTVKSLAYGIVQTDGTVDAGIYTDGSTGQFGTRTNHPLHFFTNNAQPQLTLLQNGNVGVGITAPAAKLEVAGNTNLNGDIKVEGSVVLPIKVVTADSYTVLPTDYTVVVDMQNNPQKLMHVIMPATATVGRVVKIVAINMKELTNNPKPGIANPPYAGFVKITNFDTYTTFQYLCSYFKESADYIGPVNFTIHNTENTTACSFQYAGASAGWVITDLKSLVYSFTYLY